MSYRSKSSRGYDGDDPEVFGEVIAEIRKRIDDLTLQCARITQQTGGEHSNITSNHVPTGVGEALAHFRRSLDAHFARRFEQIATGDHNLRINHSTRDEQKTAAFGRPRTGDATQSPAPDWRHIDLQLKSLSEGLAKLQQPDRRDEIILAMRDDLAAIRSASVETTPRHALEALQSEVRALAKSINENRNVIADGEKIARLERKLAELSDTLRNIKPAETSPDIKEMMNHLAWKIEQLAKPGQFSGDLREMKQDVAELRAILSQNPTNVVLEKFARQTDEHISDINKTLAKSSDNALFEFDSRLTELADNTRNALESISKALDDRIENRIVAAIAQNHATSDDASGLIKALGEQLDQRLTALADKSSAEFEVHAKALDEQLDLRIADLIASNRASAAEVSASTKVSGGEMAQRATEEADRNRHDLENLFKKFDEQLNGRVAALVEKNRIEFESQVGMLLAKRLDEQIASTNALWRSELAEYQSVVKAIDGESSRRFEALSENIRSEIDDTEKLIKTYHEQALERSSEVDAHNKNASESLEKTLGGQLANLAAELSERNRLDTGLLARKLDEQQKQWLSALSDIQKAQSESLIKESADKIDGRITDFAEKSSAELAKVEGIAKALGYQVDREMAARKISEQAYSSHGEALVKKLDEQIDRRITELTSHNRAEAANVATKLETHLTTLGGQIDRRMAEVADVSRAESESRMRELGERIDRQIVALSERQYTETKNAQKLVEALGETIKARVADVVENNRIASKALAQEIGERLDLQVATLADSGRAAVSSTQALIDSLAQRVDRCMAELAESHRVEAAKATARVEALGDKFESKLAALADQSRADSESSQTLGRQLESHILALTENSRTEAAKATARVEALGHELERKITALADKSRTASETLAKTVGEQLNQQITALTESNRAEAAKTTARVEVLGQEFEGKIAALADKGRTASETLAKTVAEQLKQQITALTESNRAEAAKTTARAEALSNELESKITALADKSHTASETLAKHISELTESNRAEATKTTAQVQALGHELESKITVLADKSRTASETLAKDVSEQLGRHISELTENNRAETAKTTARVEALGHEFEGKITALADKSRTTTETLAKTVSEQLKQQITVLTENNRAEAEKARALLEARSDEIEDRIAALTEAARAGRDSLYKAIDEQLERKLGELTKMSRAKAEALVETLSEQIDLGLTALRESGKAEFVASESLLRTLTEQIYRKIVTFTEKFRGESEIGHKQIDALRQNVDQQFAILTESLPRLEAQMGALAERLDVADAQLLRLDAIEKGIAVMSARLHAQQRPVSEESRTAIADQAPALNSDATNEKTSPQNPAVLPTPAYSTSPATVASANGVIGASPPPAKSSVMALDKAMIDGKSETMQAADPFDPLNTAPRASMAAAAQRPRKIPVPNPAPPAGQGGPQSKRRGRYLRWFQFNRAKF